MNFIIIGEIKPYVRMTRRGKWGSPQAQEYLASKAAIQMQLKEQMRGRERLGRVPIQVRIFISVADRLHTKDLDNQTKSLMDACNGIVWDDDRWVDCIEVKRGMRDEEPENRAWLTAEFWGMVDDPRNLDALKEALEIEQQARYTSDFEDMG